MSVTTYIRNKPIHQWTRRNMSLPYPKPWDIRTARMKTGLTLEEAAKVVYVSRVTWFKWESEESYSHHTRMHPAYAELFALKTGLTTVEELCPWVKEMVDRRHRINAKSQLIRDANKRKT